MNTEPGAGLSSATLRALDRAAGEISTATLARMEATLPWFRTLPAEQRANVLVIAQLGLGNFVAWLRDDHTQQLTTGTFRAADPELIRWVSLRRTVELVRLATDVFEQRIPELAADERERITLTEEVLRYSREIAFAAATSYAGAAEARGSWDARLEALMVDGIVRGDAEESMISRAAALGWDPDAEATVLVGNPPSDEPPTVIYEVRSRAARVGRSVLLSVQGSRLIIVLAGPVDSPDGQEVLARMAEAFGDGPVVAGPTTPNLVEAYRSAADALHGLRAVAAWPAAPRPVRSTDLLPERALAGDPEAERLLVERVIRPLAEAGGALLETVDTYLETGGVLETCAKQLFVHPNTVRYRLRRVTEVTGYTPSNPRDALVLRLALAVGRLARARGML